MLNYSVHALEQFSTLDPLMLPPDDRKALLELQYFLHHGIKFELPVNGSLFDNDIEKGYDIIDPTLLHVPFPAIVLEYPFELVDKMKGTNIPSPKRIAIALDYEKHKASYLGTVARQFCPYLDESGGLIMWPVFYFDGNWTPSPWGIVLPRIAPDGTNLSVYFYGAKSKPKQTQIGFMPIFTFRSICQQLMDELGPTAAVENGIHDCGEEITSLVGLLAALSCSNVKINEEPAPAKLNAKRVKNGKLPFYSYKFVSVVVNAPKGGTGKGGSGLTDSGRQSPREHLRRGHIRRLAPGKNTWVQSSVVGAATKGKIDKAYVVGVKEMIKGTKHENR